MSLTSFNTFFFFFLKSCIGLSGFFKGITALLRLFTTPSLDLLFRLGFFVCEM